MQDCIDEAEPKSWGTHHTDTAPITVTLGTLLPTELVRRWDEIPGPMRFSVARMSILCPFAKINPAAPVRSLTCRACNTLSMTLDMADRLSAPMRLFYRCLYWLGANRIYKNVWRFWYPLMTRGLRDDEVLFINWAYEEDPPMALPLAPTDEPNRGHIQLYHRVATQVDLTGKRVLEVSCGHGGGASYLNRALNPASYTGLDLNPAGIAFCQKRHDLAGLDFVQGDAENLPFDDESFDVVLNVEASHCYPRVSRFLAEVVRVLRPGGHFLYADLRPSVQVAAWESELAGTEMRMLSEQVINAEVLRGMDKRAARSRELIDRHMPSLLHIFGPEFAGLPGSHLYRAMQRRDISYRVYSFTKD